GELLVLGTDILGFGTGVRSSDALGLKVGHRVLLDDGRLECRITALQGTDVSLSVLRGGLLRTKKGVNLPDTEVLGGVLSTKDIDDIAVARELGAEIIAVSFVQHPEDVVRVRELAGPEPLIFSKIERPQAIERLEEICRVSDGVMAARGDLGVELPYEELPSLQRRIALTALKMGVISICATEMVESMTTSTRPTRAEVADVSAAVRDGFDAVMLSGETAVGHNPPLAVSSMVRIAEVAERNLQMPNWFADENPETAAVTAAAAALAKRINADWIVALTYTGYSARLLAACRPSCPIIAVTPDEQTARRLSIVRGVYPRIGERNPDVARSIEHALSVSRSAGMIVPGNKVVVCVSRLSARSDADTILLHNER
ncbi:MAG: pyruvate kinase, partial [Actinobacteria bacterium]|nr:pyruvate kinase [Actinomycetota bacterium]